MSDYRIEQISRKKITWPVQERKHFGGAELAELAATIRVHGILEPIGVIRDGDGYQGLWGQRRWMAAELAGLELIPAVVRDKPRTEAEGIETRLIENLQREALRPLEQSAGLDQLMKASGLTASDVAKRVGMKPAAVTKSLSLLQLSEPIRQQIDAGLISAGAGYELARVEDPRLRSELAAQIAGGTLTRDALAGRVKTIRRPVNQVQESKKSRVTAKLRGGRLVTVSGPELTLETFIAAMEELLTRARTSRAKGHSLATLVTILADDAKRTA
ncbi:MAG TPA: ParB/RepB/Spo0J family partition protein [Tepidisphaeraceae bacterium]|jgi:ParB family chromosome partitioning protein|nr:ParB/RepB/Spo0J family partition protein [Tepidisphaeraceae bacterium]